MTQHLLEIGMIQRFCSCDALARVVAQEAAQQVYSAAVSTYAFSLPADRHSNLKVSIFHTRR